MLKNIRDIFLKKRKVIEDEIALKFKIDEIVTDFVKNEILKKAYLDFQLSYTFNKNIIKIETENKLVAQEIALRIRIIENKLKDKGIIFKKLLV